VGEEKAATLRSGGINKCSPGGRESIERRGESRKGGDTRTLRKRFKDDSPFRESGITLAERGVLINVALHSREKGEIKGGYPSLRPGLFSRSSTKKGGVFRMKKHGFLGKKVTSRSRSRRKGAEKLCLSTTKSAGSSEEGDEVSREIIINGGGERKKRKLQRTDPFGRIKGVGANVPMSYQLLLIEIN